MEINTKFKHCLKYVFTEKNKRGYKYTSVIHEKFQEFNCFLQHIYQKGTNTCNLKIMYSFFYCKKVEFL